MKIRDWTFADHAALEILPALVKHFGYLGDRPEQQVAREAYKLADALAAEHVRRHLLHETSFALAVARAERAEITVQILRTLDEKPTRVVTNALADIWTALGVTNQAAAMQEIHGLLKDTETKSFGLGSEND